MKLLLLLPIALYLCGGMSRFLFLAGTLTELAYLASRGIELGRLPLIGPHDTLVFFSTSCAVMALPFLFSASLRDVGLFRWGTALLAALSTLMALPFPAFNMPMPPILNTLWFELHVALAFFAYALFGIGALLGMLYLRRPERPFLDLQYKAALVGFSFFSASMTSGGVWGYYAWGTYWLWTPKEFWTSILWLYYSFYLHIRLKGPAWERTVAWGGIIGFGVTMFTYLGVS
ncbi:MAG TPA: cytochrome c biogenesis protein CcsA, partial [Geobacteraceae bacterium]|nr:cytochrome c biogenesis protein CcsA [Geobacteraceae bacterium]